VKETIMKSNSMLIVGCGDLGARVGRILQEDGREVHAVRRDISRLPPGFVGHAADYTEAGSLDFAAALRPDYVLATFTPADMSEAGYQRGFAAAASHLVAGLADHRPRRILLVSSTRVFAEADGGWVDETSELSSGDPRAGAIIAAERCLLESGHSVSVVRFAGIYGAPDGYLLQRVRRGELAPSTPVRFTNRIHRDDCAGFILHLLGLAEAGESLAPIYIGVDDCPAPQHEVDLWLAARLGGSAGERGSVRAQPPGKTASSHKRCSNRLLHTSGYRLLYRDYRSGYAAVLGDRTL
jgi:nucleoside-diphosphate-sugar epimerase